MVEETLKEGAKQLRVLSIQVATLRMQYDLMMQTLLAPAETLPAKEQDEFIAKRMPLMQKMHDAQIKLCQNEIETLTEVLDAMRKEMM